MSKAYLTVHDFSALNVNSIEQQLIPAGAAYSAGNTASGDIILLNSTSGSSVTLPSNSPGLHFTFLVSNTGAHTITSPSANLYGGLNVVVANSAVSSNLVANGNTVISTTSGSSIGDTITLLSDDTKYYVSGTVSRFNGLKMV
jgi:hypothetical protein